MHDWAINRVKLERAKAGATSEEQIKENYIKLGGKVVETPVAIFAPEPDVASNKSDTNEQTEDKPVETPLARAKKRRLASIP